MTDVEIDSRTADSAAQDAFMFLSPLRLVIGGRVGRNLAEPWRRM
jgi:hypothetical protein